MEVKKTHLEGALVLQPRVFFDDRGYFYESYNLDVFKSLGITETFVQDNQSKSQKGALRGLHFQAPPHAQGKLVRVVKGAVYDVIVDIRKSSPTYGEHFGIELNEENFTMLWVPPGFAHGFSTLRDETIFNYKCTDMYNKASEGGILWDDADLNIDWKLDNPILSDKDKQNTRFANFNSPFN